jgi:hypothetical protein
MGRLRRDRRNKAAGSSWDLGAGVGEHGNGEYGSEWNIGAETLCTLYCSRRPLNWTTGGVRSICLGAANLRLQTIVRLQMKHFLHPNIRPTVSDCS